MYRFGLLLYVIALFSCTPSRLVKPLAKSQIGVAAHVGGPLIKYGNATIPMPLSSISAAYGWKDATSVFGSVHTTALLFGVGFIDLGVVHRVVAPQGYMPGVSITPMINVSTDFYKFKTKAWPQVDANVYWEYGKEKQHFVYAGVNNWFELATHIPNTEQKVSSHWFLTPQLGNTWVTSKWRYSLELKWSAANRESGYNVGGYSGMGGRGAVGVYVSVMRYF